MSEHHIRPSKPDVLACGHARLPDETDSLARVSLPGGTFFLDGTVLTPAQKDERDIIIAHDPDPTREIFGRWYAANGKLITDLSTGESYKDKECELAVMIARYTRFTRWTGIYVVRVVALRLSAEH